MQTVIFEILGLSREISRFQSRPTAKALDIELNGWTSPVDSEATEKHIVPRDTNWRIQPFQTMHWKNELDIFHLLYICSPQKFRIG